MRIRSGKSVYNSNVMRTIWNRRRIERKFNFLSFSIVFLVLVFVLNLIYSIAWKKERRMLTIENEHWRQRYCGEKRTKQKTSASVVARSMLHFQEKKEYIPLVEHFYKQQQNCRRKPFEWKLKTSNQQKKRMSNLPHQKSISIYCNSSLASKTFRFFLVTIEWNSFVVAIWAKWKRG